MVAHRQARVLDIPFFVISFLLVISSVHALEFAEPIFRLDKIRRRYSKNIPAFHYPSSERK